MLTIPNNPDKAIFPNPPNPKNSLIKNITGKKIKAVNKLIAIAFMVITIFSSEKNFSSYFIFNIYREISCIY